MAAKALPCPTLLRLLLDYDPETGTLTWRPRKPWMFPERGAQSRYQKASSWNRKWANAYALTAIGRSGYRHGTIHYRTVGAHRVCFSIYYGKHPSGQIDHINGIKLDNRISNLRDVEHAENMKNMRIRHDNKSGHIGVSKSSCGKMWRADISINGSTLYLGKFPSVDEAVSARSEANMKYGFHPNHGITQKDKT